MRRMVGVVVLHLLVVAPALEAQRVAPTAVRRAMTPASAPGAVTVLLPDDQSRFHGERILFGAALGALILAPLSAMYAQGQCESADCQEWKRGLWAGAAVGAVLGGLFGLTWALPARSD